MSLEGKDFPSGRYIPDPYRPVVPPAGQALAVRAEHYAGYPAGMSGQRLHFLARPSVPHFDALLQGGRHASAVRTERHGRHDACPILEVEDFVTGDNVPHLHELVVPAAGQALPVRAEREAVDERLVAPERYHELASGNFPHFDRRVALTLAVTGCQRISVVTEC